MPSALIGSTGFIGQNLVRAHSFSDLYCSANIAEIAGKTYDLLVCAAPGAAKWKINQAPAADRANIESLAALLAGVRCRRAVLISTVDVYPHPIAVDETSGADHHRNHAYGTNRRYFETLLAQMFPNFTILRLPGLFGTGLKKNVIFDLLHHHAVDLINPASEFQYYDLRRLWNDMEVARIHDVHLLHLATEPVRTQTIVDRFFPGTPVGTRAAPAVRYDMRTRYASLFGREGHYRLSAAEVLDDLEAFVCNQPCRV